MSIPEVGLMPIDGDVPNPYVGVAMMNGALPSVASAGKKNAAMDAELPFVFLLYEINPLGGRSDAV